MPTIYIDIETIPGPNPPAPVALVAPTPESIAPDSRLKDPEKIAADIAAKWAKACDKWEADNDAADANAVEDWKKQALVPWSGRIICICAAVDGQPVETFVGDDAVTHFGRWLGTSVKRWGLHEWCGFNIREFDLPYLRLHLLGIDPHSSQFIPYTRYDKSVVDLREILSGGVFRAPGRLSDYADFFGLDVNTAPGSHVFDLWQAGDLDGIAAHCREDVELVRELANIVGV